MPICRIPVIVTVRCAVAPAVPAAAATAALAAWVCAAIIWLAAAIRACAAAIRSATGGMVASICLACFCRSRMLLKTPMSGRPVKLVETLRHGPVPPDPLVPPLVGGLPVGSGDPLRRRDLRQLGRIVAERRDALADRDELLDRDTGDRVEVGALGEAAGLCAEGLARLGLVSGLLGRGHLLRLRAELLRLRDHAGSGLNHVPHVPHPLEHSHRYYSLCFRAASPLSPIPAPRPEPLICVRGPCWLRRDICKPGTPRAPE